MSATDDFVRNAERYAAAFDKGSLPMPPGKQTAVVACMDARLNPYGILGLSEGDAHVIRNAGGVVTDDVIRSLTISQRLLGTREIDRHCATDREGDQLLRHALARMLLSARAYHRVLRVARSIADLAGRATIAGEHIAEAIQYRRLDASF